MLISVPLSLALLIRLLPLRWLSLTQILVSPLLLHLEGFLLSVLHNPVLRLEPLQLVLVVSTPSVAQPNTTEVVSTPSVVQPSADANLPSVSTSEVVSISRVVFPSTDMSTVPPFPVPMTVAYEACE